MSTRNFKSVIILCEYPIPMGVNFSGKTKQRIKQFPLERFPSEFSDYAIILMRGTEEIANKAAGLIQAMKS